MAGFQPKLCDPKHFTYNIQYIYYIWFNNKSKKYRKFSRKHANYQDSRWYSCRYKIIVLNIIVIRSQKRTNCMVLQNNHTLAEILCLNWFRTINFPYYFHSYVSYVLIAIKSYAQSYTQTTSEVELFKCVDTLRFNQQLSKYLLIFSCNRHNSCFYINQYKYALAPSRQISSVML